MIRLTFLGDVMATKEQLDNYWCDSQFDFYKALEGIKIATKDSDYTVANLETPVSSGEYTNEPYSFNAPESLLKALKTSGVDMVQTANNHCLDRGIVGLKETIQCIKKNQLNWIGTHEKPEDMYKIIPIGGISIGFLAATYGTNAFLNHVYLNKEQYFVDLLQRQELSKWSDKIVYSTSMHIPFRILRRSLRQIYRRRYSVPLHELRQKSKVEEDRLESQIRACKDHGADYIVVCLHIGGQYNSVPTEYTKKMISFCRRCGANVVIANHEHVIHSYLFEAAENNCFFASYSLGNLLSSVGVCSNPYDKYAEYSIVYHIDLERNNQGIKSICSFQLFCSHYNYENLIVTEPIDEWLNKCVDTSQKNKILSDCKLLLNRIYGTNNKSYEIKPLYVVNPIMV